MIHMDLPIRLNLMSKSSFSFFFYIETIKKKVLIRLASTDDMKDLACLKYDEHNAAMKKDSTSQYRL